MVEVIVGFLNLAEDFSCVRSLEGKIPADQRIEQHAKRPDVCLLTIGALKHFRRHIVRRTSHSCQLTIVTRGLGKTEVDQTYRVVVGDHDIVRLDIPMNDILRVTMVDRLEQTFHVACRGRLSERLIGLLCYFLEQLGACDVFHDQVDVFLVVVGLVVLNDVGMVKRVQDRDFLHNAIDVIAELNFVQHFDSDLKVFVMLVRREEYTSEGTDAEYFGLRIDMIVLF